MAQSGKDFSGDIGFLKVSDMRAWLRDHGVMLTKSLGQNFLHDANQIQKILDLGFVVDEDKVLEIGPGMGALTGPMLDHGAQVLAIEKDKRMVEYLTKERIPLGRRCEVLHDDALELLKRGDRDWSGWKVISNLPYSVGSPIFVELTLSANPPDLIVVTLQREVIDKACAKAGDKEFGLLSVLIQFKFEPVSSFKLPPNSFFPPPDVTSACGSFKKRDSPLADNPKLLSKAVHLAKMAFQQRRKTLTKTLKPFISVDELKAFLEERGKPPTERPENLSAHEFLLLAEKLM